MRFISQQQRRAVMARLQSKWGRRAITAGAVVGGMYLGHALRKPIYRAVESGIYKATHFTERLPTRVSLKKLMRASRAQMRTDRPMNLYRESISLFNPTGYATAWPPNEVPKAPYEMFIPKASSGRPIDPATIAHEFGHYRGTNPNKFPHLTFRAAERGIWGPTIREEWAAEKAGVKVYKAAGGTAARYWLSRFPAHMTYRTESKGFRTGLRAATEATFGTAAGVSAHRLAQSNKRQKRRR